jgi:hypothetical protein
MVGHFLAQGGLEIWSQNAEQPPVEEPRESRVIQARSAPAVAIDIRHLLESIRYLLESRQYAHCLGGVIARSDEVEHVALVAWTRRVLDDAHLPTVALHPLSQCQTGDTGATDKDFHRLSAPFFPLGD